MADDNSKPVCPDCGDTGVLHLHTPADPTMAGEDCTEECNCGAQGFGPELVGPVDYRWTAADFRSYNDYLSAADRQRMADEEVACIF